jgi:hypothetical protein
VSHEIHLPHHGDITAPLSTALDAARSLPTDDARATARQIVIALAADGVDTVGAALAHLEAASPAERRRMLEDARTAAGLPSTAQVDRQRAAAHRVEPIEDEPERDELGASYQVCHEPGCRAFPVDPATGAPQRSRAKRWRCSVHAAGHEDDLRPWTSPIVIGPSGLRDLDAEEAEALAQRWEADRHKLQHEQRRAAAAAALPGIEAEARAEDLAWRSANLHVERTP